VKQFGLKKSQNKQTKNGRKLNRPFFFFCSARRLCFCTKLLTSYILREHYETFSKLIVTQVPNQTEEFKVLQSHIACYSRHNFARDFVTTAILMKRALLISCCKLVGHVMHSQSLSSSIQFALLLIVIVFLSGYCY